MMTERQVRDRIDELKEELKILTGVLETDPQIRVGRPPKSYSYSEEKVKFLTENKDMDMTDLIIKYNKKFSTKIPRTSRALYNFMCRCGIKIPSYKKKDYTPRTPESVENAIKSKEDKFLSEVGINEN